MKNLRAESARYPIIFLLVLILFAATDLYAQHPDITLLDKDMNIINPISDSVTVPFSTRQTCGMCHDYDKITSGYHFQAGWEHISDTFGVSEGKPWILSDGFLGGWYPYAFRQLARKHNTTADEIDLTVYDFVGFSQYAEGQPPCGACHPGGGGLETDRNGNRYDEYLASHPDLKDSLDGDYYQSNWDKSGVVEADCFICHFKGYNFDVRVSQLEKGNYQWASVAATGIGIVNGSVKYGTPTVDYNKRFFNEDGTITLDLSWPPPSDNCVFCHGKAEERKRGFSWDDIFNPDVHNERGVSCSACHPAGLDHQIAIGRRNVRPSFVPPQGNMRGCRECHLTGWLGSPIPRHAKIRPSHINRIACESCHIPELHRAAALGNDATTGELRFIKNPPSAKSFGAEAAWKPVYERDELQRVYPLNAVLSVYWGNVDADSIMYPLFLSEHKAAWKLYGDSVKDHNGDGNPEVYTDNEIVAGLKAFEKTLQDNQRFTRVHPVYLKDNKIYDLDDSGKLRTRDYNHEDMTVSRFSINHNVAPAGLALGNKGCEDCHDYHAHFFKGQRVVDLYGPNGKPVTKSVGYWYGCRPWSFFINTFYQRVLSPLVSGGVILVIFLITLHYHSYGPKRIQFVPYSGEVKRFSLVERGIHLFRLIAFVILAGTGVILAFNLTAWQELFFGTPNQLHWTHVVAGFVFLVTTVMGIIVWFKDAMFASYDKQWVRDLGGYLGFKGEVPAGRFNAGQKMFYWYTTIFGSLISITGVFMVFMYAFQLSTICVIVTIHAFIAFILIAGVLAHAYLGTIANPGTWRVLVDGYVTKAWAKHHHPQWFKKIMAQRGESDKLEDEEETGEGKKRDNNKPDRPSGRTPGAG